MKKPLPFLFLVFLGVYGFFLFNLSPPDKAGQPTTFVINQGDGLSTIAKRLNKHRFIRQQHLFIAYSYYLGLNKKLQAGSFQLSSSLSAKEIIETLSQGGNHDYWLKIQEGWRLEEIPQAFPENIQITGQEFIASAQNQEGYLFPDSYLIPPDYTVSQILQLIKSNFDQKFSQAQSQSTNSDLTDQQIIILASLLEREAKSKQDKKIIAGILLNRLDINMALQVDATVQYARDSKITPQKYWNPPTKTELSINSIYNTYKHTGLPPTPICNPGLDALMAAFKPTDSDYLFYLSDNNGQMHYAVTLEKHNQNIENYLR